MSRRCINHTFTHQVGKKIFYYTKSRQSHAERGKTLLDGNVDDADVLVRFVCLWVDLDIGDPLHHLHPFCSSSKHGVLVVQPRL